MPFDRTFGPEFQEFLTKDEVAQGHADWAKRYGVVSFEPLLSTFSSRSMLTLCSQERVAVNKPRVRNL